MVPTLIKSVAQCVRTLHFSFIVILSLSSSSSSSSSPSSLSLSLSLLYNHKMAAKIPCNMMPCNNVQGRKEVSRIKQRKKSSYNVSTVTASTDSMGSRYYPRVGWYGQAFILPHWSLIRCIPPLQRMSWPWARQLSAVGAMPLPNGAGG